MLTIAKTVKIHDIESDETISTLKRNDDKKSTFYSISTFGDSIICVGDDDGGLFVWDPRAQQEPIFSSFDCEQYISDIDGRYEAKKTIVCTSGEGTLTAYDLRNYKMIEPQSELFEAGFQCVKWTDKKIVVGGEDGAVYVFNQNEWAHTSGKFAICDDSQNRGKCSIDALDSALEGSIFLGACSDGRVRAFTLWPHKLISENVFCKKRPLESLQVDENKSRIVISGDEYLSLVSYSENDQLGTENDNSDDDSSESDAVSPERTKANHAAPQNEPSKSSSEKMELDGDYLNLF